MNSTTIQRLHALNRAFYAEVSTEFSRTRQAGWPGWQQAWEYLTFSPKSVISVLDIGCGNGRFAHFLKQKTNSNFDYAGFDTNDKLLLHAKELLAIEEIPGQVFTADMFAEDCMQVVTQYTGHLHFNLIVSFGVLHHLPSHTARLKWITQAAQAVVPRGYLIISLWQFAQLPRYQNKFLNPAEYGITAGELEAGDYLLGWDAAAVARYCHSFSEGEIQELATASGLTLISHFKADGKEGTANAYLVLQRN